MKSVVTQLLEAIPTAAEIKAFISENDADEKMLDNWIWEKVFKSKDWQAMERKQIIEAGNICGNMLIANDIVITGDHSLSVGENYYNQTYNK